MMPFMRSISFQGIFDWARDRISEITSGGVPTEAERAQIRAQAKADIDRAAAGNTALAARMKQELDKSLNDLEKMQNKEAAEKNVFSRLRSIGAVGVGVLFLVLAGGLFLRVRGRA